MASDYPVIKTYYQGTSRALIPGLRDACSHFGGPCDHYVSAADSVKTAIVHSVGSLNLPRLGIGAPQFGFSIPLLYGFCQGEGCCIAYRKTAPGAVEITEISPQEPEEDCPYPSYPALLPYYQLGFSEDAKYTPKDLEDYIGNTGWGINEECLYVVVQQHPAIGHCLFDPMCEAELVFEYNPTEGTFRGANQCT